MGFTARQPMWVILCRKQLIEYYVILHIIYVTINKWYFYLNSILFPKRIGQQAYKPIISPLLLLVGLVKHSI